MGTSTPPAKRSPRAVAITLVFGAASAGLYLLLFLLSGKLPEWAAAAREGAKVYALIPILIALIFSFVHGAFTGHFWDLLGLRPKKKQG